MIFGFKNEKLSQHSTRACIVDAFYITYADTCTYEHMQKRRIVASSRRFFSCHAADKCFNNTAVCSSRRSHHHCVQSLALLKQDDAIPRQQQQWKQQQPSEGSCIIVVISLSLRRRKGDWNQRWHQQQRRSKSSNVSAMSCVMLNFLLTEVHGTNTSNAIVSLHSHKHSFALANEAKRGCVWHEFIQDQFIEAQHQDRPEQKGMWNGRRIWCRLPLCYRITLRKETHAKKQELSTKKLLLLQIKFRKIRWWAMKIIIRRQQQQRQRHAKDNQACNCMRFGTCICSTQHTHSDH